MASQRQLSVLTIGVIFAVVFAGMQLGLEQWDEDNLEYEQPDALERQLQAAVWDVVDEKRAARNISSANRESAVQSAAQKTARALVERDYFEGPTGVGIQSGKEALPNQKGFCARVPVKVTTNASDWDADGQVSNDTARAVAERVVGLLATSETPSYLRSNDFGHGVGVAVDGRTVYVVYRSCSPGY